jgi:hypothetical protein
MSEGNRPPKFLRFIGILLMGLTAVLLLLAGIGTTCVVLGAENYPSMVNLVDYKWLYQIFVVLTVLVGIYAIRATVSLVRKKANAYRQALVALSLGLLIGGIHMYASLSLRDSAAPVNFIFYINAFTLLVFLIFRIPGIWSKVDFSGEPDETDGDYTAGAALIIGGFLTLTVHLWAGRTHTWNGINYADAWHSQLAVVGWALITCGALFTGRAFFRRGQTALEYRASTS